MLDFTFQKRRCYTGFFDHMIIFDHLTSFDRFVMILDVSGFAKNFNLSQIIFP